MTEQPSRADERTIVVPGTGRVTVEPDVATVHLGVALTRPTAAAAREAGAATMTEILRAVTAAGVERRDVQTSLLGLGPLTDYSAEGGQRVTGFQLTNTVEITVRDVAAAGQVIDAGLGAGATSLDGLAFRLADPTTAQDEARRAAVADARSRATTLAEAAGVKIAAVTGIVEGAPHGPFPTRGGIEGFALKAAADTPVETGTMEIAVSVVVTFGIDRADASA